MHQNGVVDELITSTCAGQILKKSGRTVVRHAEAGRIPIAYRLPGPNGAYLFSRHVIEELARTLAVAS
ncbi:Uncharacterised protein [Mycobacteroides abscessus subsp. abscessus]|nr:Uncharacterised protein [Mycobacteroides abscessus subsp. abscessus]SLJ03338.1 Uncharacterised protein [Mycobacteroides abscessus subsp. abscessus]